MGTKQSWYSSKGSMGQGLVIDEADGRNVAVVYDEKDAPLIAAAPELRAALERIAKMYEPGIIGHEAGDIARAVLSKAKGE